VTYTPVLTDDELPKHTGAIAEPFTTKTFAAQHDTRFVRLDIDTAWSGNASDYVGPCEVRFGGTQTAEGPVLSNDYATAGELLDVPVADDDLLEGVVPASSLSVGNLVQLTDGIGSSDHVVTWNCLNAAYADSRGAAEALSGVPEKQSSYGR